MWRVPQILVFTVLSVGFPYFTNAVQLLCSLSGWLHLNCQTNCRIAHNVGILLMNSNCFAIFFFSSILVMSVQISTSTSRNVDKLSQLVNVFFKYFLVHNSTTLKYSSTFL